MKALIPVALTIFVGACASQPEEPQTASAILSVPERAEQQVVCTRQKPTGSNRRVKVCRPVGDAIADEHTRRDMQKLQRQSELVGNPN